MRAAGIPVGSSRKTTHFWKVRKGARIPSRCCHACGPGNVRLRLPTMLPATSERRILTAWSWSSKKSDEDVEAVGRNPMQVSRTRGIAAVIAIGAVGFGACLAIGKAQSQTPVAQPAAAAASNELQRAVQVYGYNAAGKSGAARGEVIYYYKCWFCHNDYARAAGSPAPALKDIFKRANLVTGDPVTADMVAKQIRNGSPQMPAYGTALKDADIADLIAYLHNGCCYEEGKPPVNPWYRATAQNSPTMPERGDLRGGPKGTVRSADGLLLEGIMVQLIAPNAVRTTVYSDEAGQYEFPQLVP